MSTHNIGFYEVLTKTVFQSSNTHLISPSAMATYIYSKFEVFQLLLSLIMVLGLTRGSHSKYC